VTVSRVRQDRGVSDVLRPALREFGTSIFSTVTEWAIEAGAINLAQGFPDFEPPEALVRAAEEALRSGLHQYAPSVGDLPLREAVAAHQLDRYGLAWDPVTDVTATAGASEAITATLLAVLEPGDEVVLIEPCYDLYPYAVVAAGGVPRFVPTTFPDFRLDLDRLADTITDRTRVVVVNTPTNPTGQLLSAGEIAELGRLCERHDALIISDEVYEHLTYDGVTHVPVASDPVCRERTVTVSSVSKTFSATGWRIGWAVAPRGLSAAVRSAHQFITFNATTPLQRATAAMLEVAATGDYYPTLVAEYTERRNILLDALGGLDLEIGTPRGTYFVMTRPGGDDTAYVRALIAERGVAAIPGSAFYYDGREGPGRGLVRFAFCKRASTMHAAAERLK
jgi:N-succinyldiaminopimelate aminotransferase